jgi:hypothetical protein
MNVIMLYVIMISVMTPSCYNIVEPKIAIVIFLYKYFRHAVKAAKNMKNDCFSQKLDSKTIFFLLLKTVKSELLSTKEIQSRQSDEYFNFKMPLRQSFRQHLLWQRLF